MRCVTGAVYEGGKAWVRNGAGVVIEIPPFKMCLRGRLSMGGWMCSLDTISSPTVTY